MMLPRQAVQKYLVQRVCWLGDNVPARVKRGLELPRGLRARTAHCRRTRGRAFEVALPDRGGDFGARFLLGRLKQAVLLPQPCLPGIAERNHKVCA